MNKMQLQKDRIRGCLIGGAVGDALGYPVEFMREREIFFNYGNDGITAYEKRGRKRQAWISDDTQMTLFTADGLVRWNREKKEGKRPSHYVQDSYQYWLKTQELPFQADRFASAASNDPSVPWLCSIPELYELRAPGNTCLYALRTRRENNAYYEDYIADPINQSKGCGGVMRTAPAGCISAFSDIRECDMEGALDAAITHGHPLGYLTGAVLAHIVHRCVFRENEMTLGEITLEAVDTVSEMFRGEPFLNELQSCIRKAVDLADQPAKEGTLPLDQIHALGEGWIAEEALAIAVYCAIRFQDDFDRAMTVSVNHKGDSDSTGAIAGNILGAWIGYDSISDKWKKDLELHDAIYRMADELAAC